MGGCLPQPQSGAHRISSLSKVIASLRFAVPFVLPLPICKYVWVENPSDCHIEKGYSRIRNACRGGGSGLRGYGEEEAKEEKEEEEAEKEALGGIFESRRYRESGRAREPA